MGMMNTMVQAVRNIDPTMTDEIATIEMGKRATEMAHPPMVPPIFLWYNHAGYDAIWRRREWHDPTMKRPFQEYWDEALDKGWWNGVTYPTAEQEPRVFIEMGGNALRRTRGGQNMLLQHLWPKLKMVAVIDVRMSTTAMFADIVLPAAQQYPARIPSISPSPIAPWSPQVRPVANGPSSATSSPKSRNALRPAASPTTRM
jgi:hypothetical protein